MQITPLRSPGLTAMLGEYARDFDWFCFCLSIGHSPAGGHQLLQRLYLRHARTGRPGSEIYPLVTAHWDCVNAAYELAAARNPNYRLPAQQRVRQARLLHRRAVRALQQAWTG